MKFEQRMEVCRVTVSVAHSKAAAALVSRLALVSRPPKGMSDLNPRKGQLFYNTQPTIIL